MSKITETTKGLMAAAYAVNHNQYNKGFINGTFAAVGGTLIALAVGDVIAIVGTYVKNKQ